MNEHRQQQQWLSALIGAVAAASAVAALVALLQRNKASPPPPKPPPKPTQKKKRVGLPKKEASRLELTPGAEAAAVKIQARARGKLSREATFNNRPNRIMAARRCCVKGQSYREVHKEAEELIAAGKTWSDPTFTHDESSLFIDPSKPPKDWLRSGERGKALTNHRVEWHPPWKICGKEGATTPPSSTHVHPSIRPSIHRHPQNLQLDYEKPRLNLAGTPGDGVPSLARGTKRPVGMNTRGQASWLFHCKEGETAGMDDDDVAQGALGDCYFLSALSLVVTEEGCCSGLIDDSLDAAGCYGVTLFHKGKWNMVWVDGYFPCVVSNDPHSRALPKPLYAASSNRREIWPMIVEKAFAKLHGSWEAIGRGGHIGDALKALTGGQAGGSAIPHNTRVFNTT